jgi:hypothetical protein
MHCREHVVQLHRRIDELEATGAGIYVIGNGAPHFIEGFREHTGWRGPLYTDPSLAVYEAAGMKRGVLTTLNLGAGLRSIGALRRGAKQGRTQGDPWQQGGVLVVASNGDVLWSQASDGPGDNASVDEIVAAIRRRT